MYLSLSLGLSFPPLCYGNRAVKLSAPSQPKPLASDDHDENLKDLTLIT